MRDHGDSGNLWRRPADRADEPARVREPGVRLVRTHFRVSFKAAQTTGVVGDGRGLYRITAGDSVRGMCLSGTSAVAPPTPAGATVRVILAPTAHKRWCAGTFHGQVWNLLIPSCPTGKACPAIEPLPQMVGRFTFRVKRA